MYQGRPSTLVPAEVDKRNSLLLLCLSPLVGYFATVAPMLAILLAGIPIAIQLAKQWPSAMLALFLTSGIYKSWASEIIPFDVTALSAALVLLALILHCTRIKLSVPVATYLFLPLFAMTALTTSGSEKGLRFLTLTFFAIASSVIHANRKDGIAEFLSSLAAVALILTLLAIRSPELSEDERLTVGGSNPISLGRMAAIAVAFGWLKLHFAKRLYEKIVGVVMVAICAYALLAAGSRGPLLSLLLAVMATSVVSWWSHGKSLISIKIIVLFVLIAGVIVSATSTSTLPIHRFEMLFNEDKGTSILLRGLLYGTAIKIIAANPFGIGIGGFETLGLFEMRHPHNLFLEVGSELGWLPLLSISILVIMSLWTAFDVVRRQHSLHAQFLAIVVFGAFLNAMNSGDLNDNRLLLATLPLPFLFRRRILRKEISHVQTSSP